MRNWYKPVLTVVGSALLAVPLLAFALPDEKEDDKEQTQARKELKELESQREKIDSRIRDLRKKAGLPSSQAFVFGDGKLKELHALEGWKGLDGEHSIVIQKAFGEANKAVAEAMKNLPKNFEHFEKFDFEPDKHGKAFKFFMDKDGKQYKWDSNMSDEDKKKFKEQMEKMKIEIRENMKGLKDLKINIPEIRTWTDEKVVRPRVSAPEFRVIEPRVRGGGNDDSRALRDEIRALRDEVEKLRDEVKKGRGKSSGNLDRFDNAFL